MRYDISRYSVQEKGVLMNEPRRDDHHDRDQGPCGRNLHRHLFHRHAGRDASGRGGASGGGRRGHPFGPFGHRARRGLVRAAVLTQLQDEPMHGYQLMQRLEEESGGHWRPSPGSVYPTLQMLEDQGLVRGEEVEGRRVYSLTDEGRTEAAQAQQRLGTAPWDPEGAGEPRRRLRQAVFQLGAAARQVGASGSPRQVDETLAILAEARQRVYALLAQD